MHVILTPVGSAGDVNPFLIIGRALRQRGHRVTLVSPDVFAHATRKSTLEFASSGTADEFNDVTMNPDLWHPRRGPAVIFGVLSAQLRRAYDIIDRLYEPGKTVLVGHSLSFFTRVFEEKRGAPAVTIHLAPSLFRSDFAQPALPSGQDISRWPRWAKRALWWAVDRFAIDPLIVPALNQWRRELELPPVSRVFQSWLHSPQRVLGLFPDWFGAPQADWPPQLRLTGFVLSDRSCDPTPAEGINDRDLEQFLAAGPPPVVFTPGSANRHAAQFFQVGIEAAALTGQRALLVTAYGEHLPGTLPAHAHHATYASFADLFPRVAAVVHHGGIGTCAQALAAGAPQLIMPMGFDQPDNALRLVRLGVAERVPPGQFTTSRVGAALQSLGSAKVAEAATRWRSRIDEAGSVRDACDLIERALGAGFGV
jgi:rhamnosyltransferase subunit B